MKAYLKNKPLSVVWTFTSPDGTAYDITGHGIRLWYRTPRGEEKVFSTAFAASGNALNWTVAESEFDVVGNYSFFLELSNPTTENKVCRISYENAVTIVPGIEDDAIVMGAQPEETPEVVSLFTVAEYGIYSKDVPLAVGSDGYWILDGKVLKDGEGNPVPTTCHLVFEDDGTIKVMAGERIVQTVTSYKEFLKNGDDQLMTWGLQEQFRDSAENARRDAEMQRELMEADRASAERQRNAEETARQGSEANREEAEAIRRYNETQREQSFESIIVEGIGKLNDLGGKVDTLTAQMPTKADNTRVGMLESRLNTVQSTADQAKSKADSVMQWEQQVSFNISNVKRMGNTTSLDGVEIVPTLNSHAEAITDIMEWRFDTDERLDSCSQAIQWNNESLSDLNGNIGNPEELTTTNKSNLVAAVNEVNAKVKYITLPNGAVKAYKSGGLALKDEATRNAVYRAIFGHDIPTLGGICEDIIYNLVGVSVYLTPFQYTNTDGDVVYVGGLSFVASASGEADAAFLGFRGVAPSGAELMLTLLEV